MNGGWRRTETRDGVGREREQEEESEREREGPKEREFSHVDGIGSKVDKMYWTVNNIGCRANTSLRPAKGRNCYTHCYAVTPPPVSIDAYVPRKSESEKKFFGTRLLKCIQNPREGRPTAHGVRKGVLGTVKKLRCAVNKFKPLWLNNKFFNYK